MTLKALFMITKKQVLVISWCLPNNKCLCVLCQKVFFMDNWSCKKKIGQDSDLDSQLVMQKNLVKTRT